MFTIVKHPTFRTTATIQVPTDDGIVPQSINVRFRIGADDDDVVEGYGLPFLRAIILSLDDLVDETGSPVPYSDAIRDELLSRPFVRTGILRAYFDALSGAKAAARGN